MGNNPGKRIPQYSPIHSFSQFFSLKKIKPGNVFQNSFQPIPATCSSSAEKNIGFVK